MEPADGDKKAKHSSSTEAPPTPPTPPRGVRIVGNIRGLTPDEESQPPAPWILLRQSSLSQGVSISFAQQSASRKDSYELDHCYQQDEGNSLIYSKELQHLIPQEMLAGRNLTVFAYGATRSGKTYTLKGTKENPGLAFMAVQGILSKREETGYSVSISMYEVYHEHVLDLLDTNRGQVHVLEDAQGRINLKGISKVLVKSLEEFTHVFSDQTTSQKDVHINPLEPRRRCHKGLIVYISSFDDDNHLKISSKLNFIDLAGYEDSRRNTEDGLEITKINKSLYGLFNVIHALNANDNHVPYRESKLARLLKESLTRNNHILILNCLNPSFCQDTIHTVSLASRSCQRKTQMLMDSKKGLGSASKLDNVSSIKKERPISYVRQRIDSNQQSVVKKAGSISKETKIRNDVKTMKLKGPLGNVSVIKHKPSSIIPSMIISQEKAPEDIAISSSETLLDQEHDILLSNNPTPFTSLEQGIAKVSCLRPSCVSRERDEFVYQDAKENISFQTIGSMSPPLSEQLKTISENLKALCASTPSSFKIQELEPSCAQVDAEDYLEPRTPAMQHHVKSEDEFQTPICNTPSSLFHLRSSGMKQSIVQEYLNFLNSASKEELKEIKGIGEKRSTYILELRENTPEPFKKLDDLESIGLSAKQIKGMVKNMAGALFN